MSERCCEKDCKTKEQMRAVHGAPQAFWEAMLDAQADGFVTMDEALTALNRYRPIYDAAPEA